MITKIQKSLISIVPTRNNAAVGVGSAILATSLAIVAVLLIFFGVSAFADTQQARTAGLYLADRMNPQRTNAFIETKSVPIDLVSRGRNEAARSKVVFSTLIRDGSMCINLMEKRFAVLFAMFRDCRLVVYENDSEDDTRTKLEDWARRDGRVEVVPCPDSADCRGGHAPAESSRSSSVMRMRRMTAMRQASLDWIKLRHPDADYVTVFDADLDGAWSLNGIISSFAILKDGKYDALAASGKTKTPGLAGMLLPDVQYDAGAFVFHADDCNRALENAPAWDSVDNILSALSKTARLTATVAVAKALHKMVPVCSAFSGLTIYRADKIFRGGGYAKGAIADKCEHYGLVYGDDYSIAVNPYMEIFTGGNEANRFNKKRCSSQK